MKTANKPKTRFPKPGQIFLYIGMVAAMGFLNWTSTYEGKQVLNGVSGLESGLNQEQAARSSQENEMETWFRAFSEEIAVGISE